MSIAVGDRCGVIVNIDDKEVILLGYGIRVEDEIPYQAKGLGPFISRIGRKNPTILLDSGEKVYGCEGWWGSEEMIQHRVQVACDSGKTVTEITVAEFRSKPPE